MYQTDKAAALKLLNNYSNAKADEMLANWKRLATRIIVKYNDMAVKTEKDGKLLQSVTRPGYPASFGRKFVKETGDWYAVPVEKK